MRCQTAFLALALVAETVMAAKYDIRLYSDSGCNSESFSCLGTKKKTCCNDGNTHAGARAWEAGQTYLQDEIRIYTPLAGDNCGLSAGQHDDETCLPGTGVTGAMVYESGRKKRDASDADDDDDEAPQSVRPNAYEYEDKANHARYVLPLDGIHGAAIYAMKRSEDRRDYAMKHGVRHETGASSAKFARAFAA